MAKSEIETSSGNVCDLGYLIEMTGGNKHSIKEIIDVFLRQIKEELQSLNDAIKKTDFATIRSVSHTMKSTVSIMNISILLPILQEIQDLSSKAIEFDRILELNNKLNLICKKAILEIETENIKYIGC